MKNTDCIKIMVICFLITLSASVNTVYATDYYISNKGSDTNKGSSPQTPWQTITKLNAARLMPGDKVFFKRGDKFIGEVIINTSGTTEKPILISAYGVGEKPVLSGAVRISDFKTFKTNIYKAKEEKPIKTLFSNNRMLNIARHPNTGYLTFSNQDEFLRKSAVTRDNSEGKNVLQFRDNNLKQPDGYWNGASIRYRPIDWEWGYSEIASWEAGVFTLKDSCRYGFTKGYGFILENKIEVLDTIGEWYYDTKTKSVLLWSEAKPKTFIEGVVYNCGIQLAENVSYIQIHNLAFEKYEMAGVFASKNNNSIVIDSNTFSNINQIGVWFNLISKKSTISNCCFNTINGRAISANEPENMTVSGNTIKNIGLKVGYGITGVNGMAGIVIANAEELKPGNAHICLNNHIFNNYIDSIGHMGIRMDGTKSVCENNVVKNCNINMNDCGSIYCWTNAKPHEKQYTYGNTIKGNLIINSFGSNYATPGNGLIAQGIYLDGVGWMLVEGNTVINACGTGILINSGSHNQVRGNTVYDNITGIAIYNQENTGNVVTENIMFPVNKSQRAFNIMNWSGNEIDFQRIDSNAVYSLLEKYVFIEEYLPGKTDIKRKNQYTWEAWKENTGQDKNSVVYDYKSDVSKYEKNTIIYNDSFEPKEFDLANKYFDRFGNAITRKLILKPLESMILFSE